jgi:hypothetical protein
MDPDTAPLRNTDLNALYVYAQYVYALYALKACLITHFVIENISENKQIA